MDNMVLSVNILLLLGLVLYWKYGRRNISWPPGPRPYPLVGCLPQLISSGKPLSEMVRHHRKVYGDISSLPLLQMNIGDCRDIKGISELPLIQLILKR